MDYPRIKYVEPLKDYRLFIIFENGTIKIYPMKSLLKEYPFTQLKDEALFFQVHKEEHGYGIIWNDTIDLSEYEVWQNGIPIGSIEQLADTVSR